MNSAAADLQRALHHWLENGPGRQELNLPAGSVCVVPVLNWGGFMNFSFTVEVNGAAILHLKLARSREQLSMRRWLAVNEHLERHYRAPRVLRWIDVPGTDHGGLAFEHLPGRRWDAQRQPELVGELASLLDQLHADAKLAAIPAEPARTYRQCWEIRYRAQYEEDLATVRASTPPFVSADTLDWLERESRTLLAIGEADPALEGVSHAPCHWDLWTNNVLVAPDGRAWWTLDWDDLSIGDDAEDLATLVWPLVFDHGGDWRELLGAQRGEAFAARMELHLRAIALDWTIDVLADWIDSERTPWRDTVRPIKQELHLRNLRTYRSRWG